MQTEVVRINPDQPEPEGLARAAALLRAGEVVAFPTETVYGLGACATDPRAVAKIFAAKERPGTDPLIVHIADLDQIEVVTGENWYDLHPAIRHLGETYWPGPLTIVLPKGPQIPDLVTAGLATVGVRLPDHPVALALIQAAGVPIAAPSANRFGHTSPTTAQHVLADLDGRIPLILDGGPCQVGIESTIIDVTGDVPVLLRPGGLDLEAIELVMGMEVIRPQRRTVTAGAAPAPGMSLSHYAPHARLQVIAGQSQSAVWEHVAATIRDQVAQGRRVGALVPAAVAEQMRAAGAAEIADLGDGDNLAEVARRLFAGLRALDDAGVEVIVAGSFAGNGLALALRDRLWRAAGGNVIDIN